MKINKADLVTDGDKVRLTMPLTKVDQEKRIVSGWASLDNMDTQKDVILAEANKKAFSGFRGNIREMHQPVAVGRMVNFTEDVYFDKATGKFYNGIYVDVYVSKGAQDTWEKVLDGTLTGFSIGGNILDAETKIDKSFGDTPVRVVKDYELVELSLVDSPANQLASVLSIHKTAGGTFVDGLIAKVNSESVFYCTEDGIAKTSNDEVMTCPEGHTMKNIGWIEYEDDASKTEKVKEVIDQHDSSHKNTEQELPATNQGGVDVAEENEDKTVEPGETVPADVAPAAEGKAETEVASSVEEVEHEHAEGEEHGSTEKAADVSEVEVEEPDFEKMFAGLAKTVTDSLEATRTQVAADVTKATETFTARVAEVEAKQEDLAKSVDSLTEQLATVSKALETVDAGTAVKKSSDLGGSTEDTLEKSTGSSKSTWGGVFVPPGGRRFLSVTDIES